MSNGDKCVCGDKETWHKECYMEQAGASSLSDLLASMNEFIDTIRHLQYEAQEKGARLESDFQTGKDYAYGDCAERLTKIVKAL